MSAKLTSSPALHSDAAEYHEHLLLDPRPKVEQNKIVMAAMQQTSLIFWLVIGLLALLGVGGLFGGWIYEIRYGLGVTGMRRPVYWGIYITSFVFWIGISHSGTFVSAILRVLGAKFRRPITRAAELMTTASLLVAVLFLGIDIGRPWRSYWILPYPNQRGLWPNFHSPFLWDEFAIISYLVGSTLYLYLPLIPDLAMARDHTTGWRYRFYRTIALGWRGTEKQWRYLQSMLNLFAFVIIPVMFSVHTIVSWDFAMTNTVGWRSSIFGPYFIVGAIYSGVSAVIIVLLIIRTALKLDYFIRREHFETLAKLVLTFSFAWAYFFFADFLTEWYSGDAAAHNVLQIQFAGEMSPYWYTMLFFNLIVPWSTLWNKKIRRSPRLLFLIALGINIGMYLERFIIVTGVLRRNLLPFNWGHYAPSWVELLILIGSFSLFLLLYALLTRLLPMIPVWEVRDGQLAHQLRKVGKAELPSVTELES